MAFACASGVVKALPETLTQHIKAAVDVSTPTAAVKELLDNALDAKAASVSIEISPDTVDLIQVRDDGTGIIPDNRPLVARRYCTNKIRDLDDLRRVGGSSLGFRGVALASIAATSGSLTITTRTEGDGLATKLHIDTEGGVIKEEHASAGTGTTVRVSAFLKHLPVRAKVAKQQAAKTLVEIKFLLQAYALARPAIRLSLRVLKAKSVKNDFMYAPHPGAGIEDAVLKALGRDVSSQCSWSVWEQNGYRIKAFLPRSDSDRARVRKAGQFLAVDSRPVSMSKGTSNDIASAVKYRVKAASQTPAAVSKMFFCLDIVCPPEDYDANVEPLKDDLLFHDPAAILDAVNGLLNSTYPGHVQTSESEIALSYVSEAQTSPSPSHRMTVGEHLDMEAIAFADLPQETEPASIAPGNSKALFRSNMYGSSDDEELDHGAKVELSTATDHLEALEQDERETVPVNPWTIAKMNTIIRPRKDTDSQIQQATPPPSDPVVDLVNANEAKSKSRIAQAFRSLPRGQPGSIGSSTSLDGRGLNDVLRTQVFGEIGPKVSVSARRKRDTHVNHNAEHPWEAMVRRKNTTQSTSRFNAVDLRDEVVPFEDVTIPRISKAPHTQTRTQQSQLPFGPQYAQTSFSASFPQTATPTRQSKFSEVTDHASCTGDGFSVDHRLQSASCRNAGLNNVSINNPGGFYSLQSPQSNTPVANSWYQGTPLRSLSSDKKPCNLPGSLIFTRRTRSAGLPLERVPPGAAMQSILCHAKFKIHDVKRIVASFSTICYEEIPSMSRVKDEELQAWVSRLSTHLRMLHPGKDFVDDIGGFLGEAVEKANNLA